jgi:hypothetical protein
MGMDRHLFRKTRDDARVARKAEPEPEAPREIISLYQNASPEQLAEPAPYQELSYVANAVLSAAFEVTGEALGDERARTDKKFAALQRENARLRAAVSELRGGIEALGQLLSDLERDVRFAQASRAASDGAQMLLPIVKPRIRPKKRNRLAEQVAQR